MLASASGPGLLESRVSEGERLGCGSEPMYLLTLSSLREVLARRDAARSLGGPR